MNPTVYIVPEDTPQGERLDRCLSLLCTEISRSQLQALIKGGEVTLNGRQSKPSTTVCPGDEITLTIPEADTATIDPQPEDIPLDVLFEDDTFAVVNKAPGMVVHPAAGNSTGTLVNAALHRFGTLSTFGGADRPGIVHRLDKDTSGCIVIAKTDPAHETIAAQFANRETTKIYRCVVNGCPPEKSGRIENHLARHPRDRQKRASVPAPDGKPAITEFRCLSEHDGNTLIECQIFTGRTHQIRVHMKELGMPIVGDVIYRMRNSTKSKRLMLHAWKLGIKHPTTGTPMKFEAPMPIEFAPWL